MKPKFDAIVFDLGGVLVDWNPRYLYRKLLPEHEVEPFLKTVCTMAWNDEQDRGRPIREAERILIAQFPDKEDLIRAYYGRWEEMLGGSIEGTVEILQNLKQAGHRILGLSNWSHETFPIAERRFSFLRDFEGIVVSGYEKIKKPDPRIFSLLSKRYQIKPEQTIFIDDVPANIAASQALGFQAILFQSPVGLKESLRALGIEISTRS